MYKDGAVVSNRIVVVGGGSAGWLSALAMQNKYPDSNITVIASEEIGILGAGEGTTPYFVSFLEQLGILTSDIIRNCKGTIKTGIDFKEWNSSKKGYLHSFSSIYSYYNYNSKNFTRYALASDASGYKSFAYKLTQEEKCPFAINKLNNLETVGEYKYALHFDANLLAGYLKDVSLSRGVNYINDKVISFETTPTNEIVSAHLESNNTVELDFLVDCSGFARLTMGRLFNDEWISYKDKLPVDTAAPFFIPHNNDVRPVTEAIAMKYGWVWKIPVRDRYGCGYVFDSNHISKDEAIQEAEEYFNMKLSSPREFKFEPGRYRHTLVKNCLAIGLAQGFIEPLEATSLWVTCSILDAFTRNDGCAMWQDTSFYDSFNYNYGCLMDDILDFVHLHYMTDREDSDFWINFKYNHSLNERQKAIVSGIQNNTDLSEYHSFFDISSWALVSNGIGLLNIKDNNPYQRIIYNNYIQEHQAVVENCLSHKLFLDYCEKFA